MTQISNTYAKIFFLIQGIGVLSPWSALLTGLQFFISRFQGFNIAFYFQIPFMIFNVIGSCLVVLYGTIENLKSRMAISITLSGIFMVTLAVIAAVLPNSLGFYLSLFVIALLGLVNSIHNSSSNGFVAMFSFNYMSLFFSGTGLGGLAMNTLGLIFALSFENNQNGLVISSVVYFCVAAVFLIICFVLYNQFLKTDFAQQQIMKHINQTPQTEEYQKLQKLQINTETFLSQDSEQNTLKIGAPAPTESVNEKLNLGYLLGIAKTLLPYPLLKITLYAQTFMMFPAVIIKSKIDFIPIQYNIISFLILFNTCDTIGKYLSGQRKLFTPAIIIIGIFLRFAFIVSFIYIVVKPQAYIIGTDIFIILNTILFAFTNGFFTGALFILASEKAEGKAKQKSGVIMSLSLASGIAIGANLALILRDLGP